MFLGRYFLFRSDQIISRMPGQAKISSFFTSHNQKRPRTEDDNAETVEKNVKKVCVEVHKENAPPPAPGVEGDSPTSLPSTPPDQTAPPVAASPSTPVSPTSSPLSPEQKAKMDEKKWEAKMKLTAKNTKGVVVNMGSTWFKALEPEFTKPYFTTLCNFVEKERSSYTVYPPVSEVFTFTTVCEIKKIKVVILGQDPYHGPRQAHGLCFSVQKGIAPPPSLQNMYKELEQSVDGFKHPGHGNLTGWARQGVLLLNACLTVRASNANSHASKGWEQFTDAVISYLNKNLSGVVFMLWGSYAQKKGAKIDKKKHRVLKAVHPSPLSAYRGFFGCKHFTEANRLLQQQGKKPIDWKDLPQC